MDYLQESGASIHRRRRRRRAAITLTVVALMMIGTFAYAAAYFQGLVPTWASKPVASSACRVVTPDPAKARVLTPSAVTIHVYNATRREGLAASVARLLRTQGFQVAKIANDPLGKSIDGVGEVRYGRTGVAGATLVRTRLSGAKNVPDSRTDPTVDVVLGYKFTALQPAPKVTPPKATKPAPSC